MPSMIRSLAALALSAGALTGCAAFGSMFPSHEEVFTPIIPTLGVARVQGKDTTWSLTGTGYELTSTRRAILPSVQSALNAAAADFRAYVGGDPPTISVVALELKRRQRPDTARVSAIKASGAIPVFVRLAEEGRGMAVGTMLSEDMVSVSPVVRGWMNALAGTPVSGAAAPATRSRVPKWLEVAVPTLIDGWSDADLVSAQVGLHPDRIIPLRSIFSGDRPPEDDAWRKGRRADDPMTGDWDRRGRGGRGDRGYQSARRNPKDLPALSGAALWDAEAVSITNYLASREGRPFIGSTTRALMAGSSMDAVLAGAQMVPRDVDTLDRAWRDWLATQAEAVRQR